MKANYYLSVFLLFFTLNAHAQFTCSGCPYFVDENNPATDQVTVSGLTLPTLGVGGQGVCEVRLQILSEGIGELGIILTSPSGDQVELMTTSSFFTGTNYTYNISFVPCCEPANPDPGFPDVFDAGAGWQSNTTYTGSYYPESFECLEDFTGDANGVWTIDFYDNVVIDDHDIFGWEIIFCEGSATNCICDAEAGFNFSNYPQSACVGDPSLDLNPNINYQGANPADPSLYGYDWIISDANTGEVLSIVANPDLTGLPIGSYSVCGFSYLLADASLIPSPNGSLTLSDYQNDVNTGAYCADIMTSCAIIDIFDNLPDPILDWNITDLCIGQPYTFNVTNFDPSVNYQAFLSSGSFSQFAFSNGQLTIAGLAGPINICVSILEDCDMGQTCQVFNVINGGTPPTLSNQGDVCVGDNFNISVLPPNNTSNYTWTITGPGTITQNNNDNVDVQANGAGVIDICVEDTNGACGSPTPVCTQINVVDVPAPDIFPDPFYCIPGGFIVGNANGSATSTVYTQVSGPGTITFTNPNVVSTAFTVDVAGTYVIELTKTLNSCVVSTTATIEVLPELSVTSTATCNNGQFTIEIIFNNGSGPYTVLGTTISGNTYTSPPYPSGSAVLTTYSDANGCEGDVFFQEFCACVSDAGTMDQTPIEFCDLNGLATGIHNNDATLDSDDIGVYILHTSPTDVLGTVIDQNNSGVFAFVNPPMIAGVTYYISYVVGNDLGGSVDLNDNCLSVALGVPVTWLAPITATVGIQSDIDPCDLFLTLEAINDAPAGSNIAHQWTVISSPPGGSVSFSAPNNATTDATFLTPGTYEIRYEGSVNNCPFEDTFILTVEEAFTIDPPFINCAPDGSTYTVSFSISGGTDPILVNGLVYNGVSFESAPIINGDAYSFTITDASSCPAQFVSGNFTCPCSTDAGTMDQTLLELCGSNALAQGTYNNDGALDANDVAYFVLHDGALNSLGNIFDVNTTGAFDFLGGMNFGQTYYISYVVGNPDGSFIDVNDPCLSVSFGQPVVWNEFPVVSLPNDFETCDLQNLITANVPTGASIEWSVSNSPAGSNPFFSSINTAPTSLDVDIEGIYELTIEVSQNGCVTTETIIIEVLPQISISNLTETCEGSTYRVSFDIFGGEGDYDVNGVLLSGNTFLSEPINSGDAYAFTITDFNNCQFSGIQGVRNCDCLTDAGNMPSNIIEGCGDEVLQVDENQGAILDPDDIALYYLHDNSSTFLGNILALSTDGTFNRPSSALSGTIYYVSFVVGNPLNGEVDLNDPCLDVSIGQPIVWYDFPLNELPDSIIFCKDTAQVVLSPSVIQALDQLRTSISLDYTIQDSIINMVVNGAIDTLVTFNLVENNCSTLNSVYLSNAEALELTIATACNQDASLYNVNLEIEGGTSPYIINGDTIAGNLFTLNNIPVEDSIRLSVSDIDLCYNEEVFVFATCECYIPFHQMSGDLLSSCDPGEVLTASLVNTEVLGANDLGYFILHNRPDDTLGTIIDQNIDGTFSFIQGMNLGQVYYVSYVSGDSTLTGEVDFNDPCLSVSFGQPIVFYSRPSLPVYDLEEICGGDLTLPILFNQDSIRYRLLDNSNQLVSIFTQVDSVKISATSSGVYSLERSIGEECLQIDTISLDFVHPLEVVQFVTECSEDNQTYSLQFTLQGGKTPYTINGQSLVGNEYTIQDLSSEDPYTFLVEDASNCNPLLIEGEVDCSCPASPANLLPDNIDLCEGEGVVVSLMDEANLAEDFISAFILHDGSPLSIGNVVARYSSSDIQFVPQIPLDELLILTPVVGPSLNGQVDLEDACTLLGGSAEIIWRSFSRLEVIFPDQICAEEGSFDLQVRLQSSLYPVEGMISYLGREEAIVFSSDQAQTIEVDGYADDFTLEVVINEEACLDPGDARTFEVVVENCDCEEVSFQVPEEFCSETFPIRLSEWIISNPDGIWSLISASDITAVSIDNNILDGDIDFRGNVELSFTPQGLEACDTVYVFNLEFDAPLNLDLIQTTEVVCQGEDNFIDLDALITGDTAGRIGQWNSSSSIPGGSFINGVIQTENLTPGEYIFTYEIDDVGACPYQALQYTLIIPSPPTYIITSSNPDCFGENGSLAISFSDPSSIASVSVNGLDFNQIDEDNLAGGTYDLIITDSELCEYLEQIIIEEPEEIAIALTGEVVVNEGQRAIVDANVSGGVEPYQFEWVVNGTAISGINGPQLGINIDEDVEILVNVIDVNGCTAADIIILRIQEEEDPFVLPNVLALSSSSNNFFSIPSHSTITSVVSFAIYDRWGNLVFKRQDVDLSEDSITWDGRKGGEVVLQGVYVFHLAYENTSGELISKYGDITVLR